MSERVITFAPQQFEIIDSEDDYSQSSTGGSIRLRDLLDIKKANNSKLRFNLNSVKKTKQMNKKIQNTFEIQEKNAELAFDILQTEYLEKQRENMELKEMTDRMLTLEEMNSIYEVLDSVEFDNAFLTELPPEIVDKCETVEDLNRALLELGAEYDRIIEEKKRLRWESRYAMEDDEETLKRRIEVLRRSMKVAEGNQLQEIDDITRSVERLELEVHKVKTQRQSV